MIRIHPFKALRAKAEAVDQFSASAFDSDIREEEFRKKLIPDISYLHILNPQIFSEQRLSEEKIYELSRSKLQELTRNGILQQEEKPGFYIYRQIKNNRQYTALIALVEIEDYREGRIKKHELTRTEKQRKITSYFRAVGVNGSPVLLTHPEIGTWNTIVGEITEKPPLYDFTDEDHTRHILWECGEQQELQAVSGLFGNTSVLYIADGHHRCAALSDLYPDTTHFMACLVPENQLQIHGFHRYIERLGNTRPEDLIASLRKNFTVDHLNHPPQPAPGVIGLYMDRKWYRIEIPESYRSSANPKENLDVYILDNVILRDHLGIDDTRTSENVHFVNGEVHTDELKDCIDRGEMEAVFMLSPVAPADIFALSDFGETMPPKSTWIEPKLRSGLLVHRF